MYISLSMNGRVKKFSQSELISRLERLEELEKNLPIERTNLNNLFEIADKPTENKYFKVNPHSINEFLFKDEKYDFMQEWVRTAIIKALIEAKKKPQKYGKSFATFIPPKSWHCKTVEELQIIARTKGDHMADWVEQSLEWAQRLTNGESWEDICNTPDELNWYRLVMWKNNNAKIVGGSSICGDSLPATTVFGNHSKPNDNLYFTVPSVVIYL